MLDLEVLCGSEWTGWSNNEEKLFAPEWRNGVLRARFAQFSTCTRVRLKPNGKPEALQS
ncbi:MAG TPA: hypothetical protein VHB46_16555 [Burkholderiales bacterium]|nr:hypothetical protein [Burkholderiales bacterium]